MHTEMVELFGNPQLVLDRGAHAFDLESIAQGRIEDLDLLAGSGGSGRIGGAHVDVLIGVCETVISIGLKKRNAARGRQNEHTRFVCSTK